MAYLLRSRRFSNVVIAGGRKIPFPSKSARPYQFRHASRETAKRPLSGLRDAGPAAAARQGAGPFRNSGNRRIHQRLPALAAKQKKKWLSIGLLIVGSWIFAILLAFALRPGKL